MTATGVSGSVRKREIMRTHVCRVAIGSVLVIMAFGLAGCGSKNKAAPWPADRRDQQHHQRRNFRRDHQTGLRRRQVAEHRRVQEHAHGDGPLRLGQYRGRREPVSFEKVDTELVVVGEKNAITYRDGDPQIQDLGSGNTITKG